MASSDPRRVVLVDDSRAYLDLWSRLLQERYGEDLIEVEVYEDPLAAMRQLENGPVHLLIVDLEMPVVDGRRFVDFAVARGVPPGRIIVASSVDADQLHELFPTGDCLAVINKVDPAQQEALLMILDSVMKR